MLRIEFRLLKAFDCAGELLDSSNWVAQRRGPRRPRRTQPTAHIGIINQPRQCFCERDGIVRSNQDSAAIINDLERTAQCRRHDREPRTERFNKTEAKCIGFGIRLAIDICGFKDACDVRPLAEEFNAVAKIQITR